MSKPTEIALTDIGCNTCAEYTSLMTRRPTLIAFYNVSGFTSAHKAVLQINTLLVSLIAIVVSVKTFVLWFTIILNTIQLL
jgi:hypothetical protein